MRFRSIISLILVVLMAASLILTGCGKPENNENEPSTEADTTSTAPTLDKFPVDETLPETSDDIFSGMSELDYLQVLASLAGVTDIMELYSISDLSELSFDLDAITDEQKDMVFGMLRDYLLKLGFEDAIFKIVDISDSEGSEIICLLKMNDKWSLYVLRLELGKPVEVERRELTDENTAYYLVSHDDTTYMLEYTQSIEATDDNNVKYDYSYKLYRFGTGDDMKVEDEDYLSYTNEDEDATNASEFFSSLSNYLNFDVIVIYDPFVLTGQQWISDDEIDEGQRPQQTIETEEGVEEQKRIGFVEVDADSWLNFRVGAGIKNDKVLVDPKNPESFIKLAKGTPVTILEEVEIEDRENPLWYKIQINYGDSTLTGYSSATYIRCE